MPPPPPSRNQARGRYQQEKASRGWSDVILCGFALLCFITAFFFNLKGGEEVRAQFTPGNIDPITFETHRDNAVYTVVVNHSTGNLPTNSDWAAVELTVQDLQGHTLFSFGDDFWRAEGRDSDGYWKEVKDDYKMKLTLPVEGSYQLVPNIDSSRAGYSQSTFVRLIPKRGSSLPFTIAGVISLVVGIATGYFKNHKVINEALSD